MGKAKKQGIATGDRVGDTGNQQRATSHEQQSPIGETYAALAVAMIRPTPENPRHINEKDPKFLELVESVRARGVVVPVHVREIAEARSTEHETNPKSKIQNLKYELLAGERRLRAARAAGLATIRAINHGSIGDEEAFEITFAENFNRQDLTPMEEARACATLLEKYDGDTRAVASKMGRSTTWVRTRANIQEGLSRQWKAAIEDQPEFKNITAGHLALVARFPADTQDLILERIYDCDLESLSSFEDKCGQFLRLLAKAPWDTDEVVTLGKEKRSCSACPKRSSAQPGLWEAEGSGKDDRCLDPSCWDDRLMLHLVERYKQLKKEYPKIRAVCSEAAMNYSRQQEYQKLFGQIMRSYEYEKLVKTKADAAVAVMVLDGPDAGELRWAKIKKQATGERVQNREEKKKNDEARSILRQWQEYASGLIEKLCETKFDDLSFNPKLNANEVLLSLIAAFGIEFDYDRDDPIHDLDRRLDNDRSMLNDVLVGQMWDAMQRTLCNNELLVYGVHNLARFARVAAVIAALVGFDTPMPPMLKEQEKEGCCLDAEEDLDN